MLNSNRDYVVEGYLSNSEKAGLVNIGEEYFDPLTLNFLNDLEKIRRNCNSGILRIVV